MVQANIDRPVEARYHRLRRWRRVQAMGGFILLCSFFLPAVEACNSPFVPASEVRDFLEYGITDLGEGVWVFLFCIAAYLYGLLTCLVALRRRTRPVAAEKKAGLSIALLLGAVAVILAVGIIIEVMGDPDVISLGGAAFMIAIAISCAYWLRSVRMGAGGMLCLRWYTALCCTVWFMCWFVGGDSMYGLWLSLAGSVIIAIGCFQEARLRSRLKAWPCAGRLLSSRLQLFDLGEPRCLRCGYLLYGLTTPRCPECGHPFSWEEYGIAPEQLAAGPVSSKSRV